MSRRRSTATSSPCRCSASFSSAMRPRRSARSSNSIRACVRRGAQIEDGFSRLVIPGRMEFFPSHPGVVFDVAHNPDKTQHLVEALRFDVPRPPVLVRDRGCRESGRGVDSALVPRATGLVRVHVVRRRHGPHRRTAATSGEHRRRRGHVGAARSPIRWTRSRLRGATPTRATSSSSPARRSLLRHSAIGGLPTSCTRVSKAATRGALRVRGRTLPWGARTFVMGILNLAADSFSGGRHHRRRCGRGARSRATCGRMRYPRRRGGVDAAGFDPDRCSDGARATVAGRACAARRRARCDRVRRHVQSGRVSRRARRGRRSAQFDLGCER